MNEFARAAKIVELYLLLAESNGMNILKFWIQERLDELLKAGVKLGVEPMKREENAGRYNELDYFLNRLVKEYDDARELLKQDTDNPPDDDSQNNGG